MRETQRSTLAARAQNFLHFRRNALNRRRKAALRVVAEQQTSSKRAANEQQTSSKRAVKIQPGNSQRSASSRRKIHRFHITTPLRHSPDA
jgi:ribosomal protein L9